MALQDFMTRKALGVPMWLWVGAGSALVAGGYFYWKKSKAATTTTDTSTTDTSTPSSDAAGDTSAVGTPTFFPQPANSSVFVNLPDSTPQASAPSTDIPTSLTNRQLGTYVVKGVPVYKTANTSNPVTDQYPGGVAAAIYGLSGGTLTNPKAEVDYINIAMDALEIEMLNPTTLPPYPKGTQLKYVLHPERLAPVTTPAAQTTSTTTVAPTASGVTVA